MSNYYNTEIRIESSDRKYNKAVAAFIKNGVFMASFEIEKFKSRVEKDGSCRVFFKGERCWLGYKSLEFLRLATCDKESPLPSDLVIKSHTFIEGNFLGETTCWQFENGKTTRVFSEAVSLVDFDLAFLSGYALRGDFKAFEALPCELGKLKQKDNAECVSQILNFIYVLASLKAVPSEASIADWKGVIDFLNNLDCDEEIKKFLADTQVQMSISWLESQCLLAETSGKKTSQVVL